MRRFVIHYNDKTFSDRTERFQTKAYDGPKAASMARGLEFLGCTEVELVPEERIAA